jgi:anti-sigma-K factor RskA
MRDHERIEELISAQVLGGLDPVEEEMLRREMAEHGPDCPECRRLERDYAEVAGRLAFAPDPVPLRDGFEDQVVAAATRERGQLRPGPSPRRREPIPGTRLRPLVAVAAAVVVFAAGLGVGVLSSGEEGVPPVARVVAFKGEGGGSLSVAFDPQGNGMYLLGSDLQAPPEGSVYEVWMFQEGTPVPATCFRPAGDGSVFEFVDAELGPTDVMAVTVEPSSCPTAPTTTPILTAQITA